MKYHQLSLSFLSPVNEMDRRSAESKSFSDFVFDISSIRKMGQFLVIYKNNECWRFYGHLSDIIKSEPFAFI